jgi:hypothetical protein
LFNRPHASNPPFPVRKNLAMFLVIPPINICHLESSVTGMNLERSAKVQLLTFVHKVSIIHHSHPFIHILIAKPKLIKSQFTIQFQYFLQTFSFLYNFCYLSIFYSIQFDEKKKVFYSSHPRSYCFVCSHQKDVSDFLLSM